jgi:hypothetical protein
MVTREASLKVTREQTTGDSSMSTENSDIVWNAEGIRQAVGLKANSQVYTLIRAGHLGKNVPQCEL